MGELGFQVKTDQRARYINFLTQNMKNSNRKATFETMSSGKQSNIFANLFNLYVFYPLGGSRSGCLDDLYQRFFFFLLINNMASHSTHYSH